MSVVRTTSRQCLECNRELSDDWSPIFCPVCIAEADPLAEEIPPGEDEAVDWVRRVLTLLRERPLQAARYQTLERVQRGGQGEVVRVRDTWLKRDLALKRLVPEKADSMREVLRFLQEAQISSQLRHPGILPIFDLGIDTDGLLFYTTLLLPGENFGKVLKSAPALDSDPSLLPRALQALVRICETVAFAHGRGIVHRDLKPGNVLLGEFDDLYVIDWGSACVLNQSALPGARSADSPPCSPLETIRADHLFRAPASPYATGFAGFPGTPPYVPPEILRGQLQAFGPTVDVYAAGVILYQLLTGRLPYADLLNAPHQRDQLKDAILKAALDDIRDLNPRASVKLAAICRQAMHPDPAQRYPSMALLAEDLRAYLEQRVVSAYETGHLAELKMLVRRNRGVFAMAAVLLGGLIVAGGLVARAHFREQVAAQTTALRNAQLNARNGQWAGTLRWLATAAQAGYPDEIDLALQRIDAYTALSRTADARRDLTALSHLTDWGVHRGDVLLKMAEHELFDRATWQTGLAHARQALAQKLPPADEAFARGLLASNTPAALTNFHRTLELNPSHHGAHVHSLSLELLLGQHERLDAHFAILKAFYPEDPSPVFVRAVRLALRGDPAEAQRLMAPYRTGLTPSLWSLLDSGFEMLGESARFFDTEQMLGPDMALPPHLLGFLARCLAAVALDGGAAPPPVSDGPRIPQLPCIRQGLHAGASAIVRLALAPVASPESLLREIRHAHEIHPEALLPLMGAYALEGRRPTDRSQLREFVIRQIEFYELAAASPTLLPAVHRSARLLAALNQLDLGHRLQPPDPAARQACLANLRWFLNGQTPKPVQTAACYRFAFELAEYDLARQFMAQWESLTPDSPEVARRRVELELATGAYGEALRHLDRLLAKSTRDAWALEQKQKAREQLRRFSRVVAP